MQKIGVTAKSRINPTNRDCRAGAATNSKGPMNAKQELPHVPAAKTVEVALSLTTTVQEYTPGEQVAGVFFLAYVMAQQLGLNVSDLFNQSQRRYDHADTYFKREAQALSDYINGELR